MAYIKNEQWEEAVAILEQCAFDYKSSFAFLMLGYAHL